MKIFLKGHRLFFLVVFCIIDSTPTVSQCFNMTLQKQLQITEQAFLFGQIISINDIACNFWCLITIVFLSPPSVLSPNLSDTIDILVQHFSSCLNLFLNSHLFLFFGEQV